MIVKYGKISLPAIRKGLEGKFRRIGQPIIQDGPYNHFELDIIDQIKSQNVIVEFPIGLYEIQDN